MPEKIRRAIRTGFHGLGFKLFALLGLLLLVFVAVNTAVFLVAYSSQLERNVVDHAIQVSDVVKRSTRESMLKNHRGDLSNIVQNLGAERGMEGLWIYNKEGEIQFSSRRDQLYRTVEKTAEQCVFCHGSGKAKGTIPVENRYRFLRDERGNRVLGLINPIENEPSCSSAPCHAHGKDEKLLGLLDIQLSLRGVDTSVEETRRRIIVASCLLAALTSLLFWGAIRRFVHRPISKLIEGTRQVAHMNLDHRIDVSSDDEIGNLAASFNGMTEELQRANQAIQEWSATLERKVQQKTAALEKAQSHLVLAEKMSSLGKLSAMVAHEINNPLTGILTYAKVSLRGLERGSDPAVIADVNENLGIIRDEAKRCGEIVKNMLAFSHKTGGQMEPEDLAVIVRRSVGLIRHSFEVKGVELSMELPDGGTIVTCNADSIQQILVALLINALEAVGAKPAWVRVALERLPADGVVHLTVADNGSGIPPEILPHVFEPFFTTKETGAGTGLGLAVAYGVVTRHGGWISAESGTQGGTVFTVALPIDGPPEPVAEGRAT